MRYLPTNKLTPGMALGQDIYDGAGRLLLAKHLLLNSEYIANLEFAGFAGIYIDDEFTRGIELQQTLSPTLRSQALQMVSEMFLADAETQELPPGERKLKELVEDVVYDVMSNGDVMCNMMDIRNYDDYIFYHSVNVGVLSILVGVWHGLERRELNELATAGMLHDIGKKFLPRDLTQDKEPADGAKAAQWKKHPKLGADYLRSVYRFPASVTDAVAEHHETYNGQGYPAGKRGNEISAYARIIRLTDAYDSLVFPRRGSDALTPSDALERMMTLSGTEFDPALVNIFARKIAVYPVGCEVELSDGRHAVVAGNFMDFSLRPLVKILGTGETINLRDDARARNITVGKLVMH